MGSLGSFNELTRQSTQHISWNLVISAAFACLMPHPKTESNRTTFLCTQESSDNIPDKMNIEHLFESLALMNTQLWETSSFCWLNQTFMPSTSIQNKDILSSTKSLSNIWRQLASLSLLSFSLFSFHSHDYFNHSVPGPSLHMWFTLSCGNGSQYHSSRQCTQGGFFSSW